MPVAATGPCGRRSYEVADPSAQFRGGYGVVFQAVLVDDHLGPDRRGLRVSLKLLSGADDERWGKLVSRSPELARLAHPHLAAHLEVFDGPPLARAALDPDEPTHHWTANEWVPGQPLAGAPMNMAVDEVIALFAGSADAVDFLHAAGVAHRDLHPRNLIFTDDRRLVVIDYDTALTAASTTTTRTLGGTQFTADMPDAARADPLLADGVAFARCVLHVIAGDSDGALDDHRALESALSRTRPHLADPDRFANLLRAGLAATSTTGCSEWVRQLALAATTPPWLYPSPDEPAQTFHFLPSHEGQDVHVVAEADPAEGEASPGDHRLHLVALDSSGRPVDSNSPVSATVHPGERTSVALEARNLGWQRDTIELRVSGCPAGWVEPSAVMNLYPNPDQVQPLEVALGPPRDATAQPGTYDLRVEVRSLTSPGVASNAVHLRLRVLAYADPEVAVRPDMGVGRQCRTALRGLTNARFEVAVTNKGNETVEARLQVSAETVRARVWPVALRVAPGREEAAAVRVTPRRRTWFGTPKRHLVFLEVELAGGDCDPIRQVVYVVHRPLLAVKLRRAALRGTEGP